MLRLAQRHQDRRIVDPWRHRVQQRAQRLERIIGKSVELRVEWHARSCGEGNRPQVTRSLEQCHSGPAFEPRLLASRKNKQKGGPDAASGPSRLCTAETLF